MGTDTSAGGLLTDSFVEGIKLTSAATVLAVACVWFYVVSTTSGSGIGDAIVPGLRWLSAGVGLFLAGFIVIQAGYGVVDQFRLSGRRQMQRGTRPVTEFVLRATELGLAVVLLAVIGFYEGLLTTQPGGERPTATTIGVVFIVGVVSVLLSVNVVARGVVQYTWSAE